MNDTACDSLPSYSNDLHFSDDDPCVAQIARGSLTHSLQQRLVLGDFCTALRQCSGSAQRRGRAPNGMRNYTLFARSSNWKTCTPAPAFDSELSRDCYVTDRDCLCSPPGLHETDQTHDAPDRPSVVGEQIQSDTLSHPGSEEKNPPRRLFAHLSARSEHR